MKNDNNIVSYLNKRSSALVDAVELALFKHINDEKLARYLEAITDAESYSGKCKVDNVLAAHRLTELCANDPVISREKLVTVQYAMNGALRRHGLCIDQRRAAAFASDAQAA